MSRAGLPFAELPDLRPYLVARLVAGIASQVQTVAAKTIWIWSDACSAANAHRWSRYLRERIRRLPFGPPSEVELIH